jgi:Ferric reductase like transmembrane component
MIPVSKNSVLQLLLGVSYTGALGFHKSMGWFFVLVSVVHVCAYIKSATFDIGKYSSKMIPDVSQLPWGESRIKYRHIAHRFIQPHSVICRVQCGVVLYYCK